MKKSSAHKWLQWVSKKIEIPVKLSLFLFLSFVLIRFMEYLMFPFGENTGSPANYLAGVRYDFLFAGLIGMVMIPLFLILKTMYHRIMAGIFGIMALLLVIIAKGLSEYYLVTLVPLDHSLLVYSPAEVWHILFSSGNIGFARVSLIAAIITIVLFLLLVLVYRVKLPPAVNFLTLLAIVIFITSFNNITPDIAKFDLNRYYYQQINKTSYLVKQLLLNYNSSYGYSLSEVPIVVRNYQDNRPEFEHLDTKYPFMRRNLSENVIGGHFKLQDEPPNIVFIIVESLSRNFSGPGARWGSFTPFIDSLAQQGLYWPNFLSTSERTFNVLPSSLGSLPYGEKGFMALADKGAAYPDFLSLNAILSPAGYHGNFFYGGWAYFDFMELFLRKIGVGYILDDNKFGDQYEKIPNAGADYSWGYPDHAVYRRSMELLDSFPWHPRIDIYLSLSMHDPFLPPDQDHWKQLFLEHVRNLDHPDQEPEFYLQRTAQFSTILYADDAIRQLFSDYRKRPDYDNTIFLIYGDHHMPVTDFNPIEKYHVPLIIYSPMLTESVVFPAVSSTADITPTISGMMEEKFDLEIPEWVPWLGTSLDTSKVFRSSAFVPFMRINRNIDELLWKDYFYSEGRLFKVGDNLDITLISDPHIRYRLERMLTDFNILNHYVCLENAIYNPEINDFSGAGEGDGEASGELPSPKTMILGHRGSGSASYSPYRENTYASVKNAFDRLHGAEVDIQCSKDGTIWLHHDADLPENHLQLNCVPGATDDELMSLRLPDTLFSLTRLEDIFILMKGMDNTPRLSLDVKGYFPNNCFDGNNATVPYFNMMFQSLREMVDRYGLHDYVMVETDYQYFLDLVIEYLPGVECYLLGYEDFEERMEVSRKKSYHGVSYNFNDPELTIENINSARQQGLKVQLWTLYGEEDIRRAIRWNADYIQTGNIEAGQKLISGRRD